MKFIQEPIYLERFEVFFCPKLHSRKEVLTSISNKLLMHKPEIELTPIFKTYQATGAQRRKHPDQKVVFR